MDPRNFQKSGKKPLNKNKSRKLFKEKVQKRKVYARELELILEKYDHIDPASITTFSHFPLSLQTQKGLKKWNYVVPTEIQREAIGLALKGHDILGAAKTGSGKTLAFVIPVLECLYRVGWSRLDGLGSLVITPIRELAYQIFEIFNKVGAFHYFSVALAIGGKDLVKERKMLDRCNIVICTPGRLLQHMDENPLFDAINLQILVLDEADRMLDLGFQQTMNAVIDNLPEQRQTLLFSATQTKSVKDLARLSLKNPMYVSVHEHAKHSTPESLQQSYLVCEAQSKMNLLWSFIKNHKMQKILVFMSSCKQVKYTYEAFCRMKPGVTLLALYSTLHQLRRMDIYDNFCRKNYVVMFATDIASRGLDFPNINWVVQMDCPEDVKTYIHRAGRTARYQDNGKSLLVLLPSEKDYMVKQLEKEKIPISEIKVSPKKISSIQRKMEILCARDVNLKESAQRAYQSYMKGVFLMKDKTLFNIQKIDAEAYAKSLGLAFTPRTRFVKKSKISQENVSSARKKADGEPETKVGMESEKEENSDESDDDFLIPKKAPIVDIEASEEENYTNEIKSSTKPAKPLTKAAVAKKIIRKNIKPNVKVAFNEEGEVIEESHRKQIAPIVNDVKKEMMAEGYSVARAMLIMEEEDLVDKELYRQKIKEKHWEERIKQKELKRKEKGQMREEKSEEMSGGVDSDNSVLEQYIDELPDPDKYYGSKSDHDDEKEEENVNDEKEEKGHSSGVDSEFERESLDQSGKRKRKLLGLLRKKVKRGRYDEDQALSDSQIAFDDEEDLALQLLKD